MLSRTKTGSLSLKIIKHTKQFGISSDSSGNVQQNTLVGTKNPTYKTYQPFLIKRYLQEKQVIRDISAEKELKPRVEIR